MNGEVVYACNPRSERKKVPITPFLATENSVYISVMLDMFLGF